MHAVMEVLVRYGYVVVFGAVLAEQIGLPFPSEPVLLAAGALVGQGHLRVLETLGLVALASLIGDTVWYGLGRIGGPRVLGWLCRLTLEPSSCVHRTQTVFGTHGSRVLLVAKFVPGLSTVAPPLAGVARIPLREFLAMSLAGAVIWAGAFLAVGWLFSAQLEWVADTLERLGSVSLVLTGLALAAYIGWKTVGRQRFLRRVRLGRITPEELKAKIDAGDALFVVDVRDQLDFDAEPALIPGALHLTAEELDARHREIPRERDVVLYCTCPSEASSERMALRLRRRGIVRVRPLLGGFRAWRERGYPMVGLAPAISGGSDE